MISWRLGLRCLSLSDKLPCEAVSLLFARLPVITKQDFVLHATLSTTFEDQSWHRSDAIAISKHHLFHTVVNLM